MPAPQPPASEPLFAIAAGNPTASEIAAVVTVLAARLGQAGGAGAAPDRRSGWSARSAMMRSPVPRGPGAWRAAALPR